MHILVAEDDPVSRTILVGMLATLGHCVCSTHDGRELLRVFQETPYQFDAIVTDVMMPFMNGLEAVRAIKRIRRIRAVAVTACGTETRIDDGDGRNIPWGTCDFVLRKPLEKEWLCEVLAEIADENRHLAEQRRMGLTSRDEKELTMYGLYFACPALQERNPVGCQLHVVRKSCTFNEFRRQIRMLPEERIDEMLQRHQVCPHNQRALGVYVPTGAAAGGPPRQHAAAMSGGRGGSSASRCR